MSTQRRRTSRRRYNVAEKRMNTQEEEWAQIDREAAMRKADEPRREAEAKERQRKIANDNVDWELAEMKLGAQPGVYYSVELSTYDDRHLFSVETIGSYTTMRAAKARMLSEVEGLYGVQDTFHGLRTGDREITICKVTVIS